MDVDASGALACDERQDGGRRNRVVLAPRRWRQVSRRRSKLRRRMTVAKKPGAPGRARISRNTIAQGRPDVRLNLWFCRVLFCCTRTVGAAGTRPSLRPHLCKRGMMTRITRAHSRRENAKSCLPFEKWIRKYLPRVHGVGGIADGRRRDSELYLVIASEAKQSRHLAKTLDCFVAYAPRNDDAIDVRRLDQLFHHLRDRLAARGGVGIAAEIAGAQGAFAERALDGADDGLRPRSFRRDAPASSRPTRSCRSGWRCPAPRCRAPSRAPARTPTENCVPGLMLPDGAMPMVPVQAGPRSERMSPNRLEPTTTSNQSGCSTKFAVRMSMWYLSHFTSG